MSFNLPVNYPEMIVKKSRGITPTEKKLVRLGYNTFFRLWSFPNPYKNQECGKELCDLLVIFGDDIIIFSDKECEYKETRDPCISWRRWFKRSIKKSAEQLLGARTWVKNHPDRIALDAKCTIPLPLDVCITPETRFHLIAVAHGVKESCQKFYCGGDGGLIIDTQIVGSSHVDDNCEPFHIGLIDSNPETFVHVFDDTSYAVILQELDTTQDFLDYLASRKELLLSKTVFAAGELEILSQYVSGLIYNNKSALQRMITKNYSAIIFEEGMWQNLVRSQEYQEWKARLRISHFWDHMLQRTFFFIENGLSRSTNTPTIEGQSKLFSRLAKEDRAHRYILSEAFLSFLKSVPTGYRGTRVVFSNDAPDICYVLLVLPRIQSTTDDDYREVRKKMLADYCQIAKVDYPSVIHIIGIAHEPVDNETSSEDFVYLDAAEWPDDMKQEALRLKQEYQQNGLLAERTNTSKTYYESTSKIKGRDRNKPCPCGSGKKYKKCCGRPTKAL